MREGSVREENYAMKFFVHKILQGIDVIIKRFLIFFICFIFSSLNVIANEAKSVSADFSINLGAYMQITSVTSPILMANITDDTGNLYAPLQTKFRVISNQRETQTLYLKANTTTEGGIENAMFEYGGRVYIAFASVTKQPKHSALVNCKMGTHPNESPGIVAYPITSVIGAKHKYKSGKACYEVEVGIGTTYVTVNVGSHVLENSFDKNDPKGFYQATLSLTEADI